MIKQAAIMRDGKIWTLPSPARHHHILWAMYDVDNGKTPADRPAIIPARGEQGFVTNEGEFLNRIKAAEHAEIHRQLIKPLISPPNLYSEDLW